MLNLNSKRGFSLVELLIVIGIIGVLSSVVLVSLGNARAKGRLASVQSSLSAFHSHLIMCVNDGKTVNFSATAPVAGGELCNGSETFPVLPSNWSYTISPADSYSAVSSDGDLWTIICSETGCVTTP
ncbi:MAG: type II secretion system protein [Candidatus Portnoybacteria bacterium]|nr:type II secretion system protein [Candidatus Portnoybacteria bacterium]